MDKYMVMLCFPSVFSFFASFTFYSVLSCLFLASLDPCPRHAQWQLPPAPNYFIYFFFFYFLTGLSGCMHAWAGRLFSSLLWPVG